MIWVRIKKREKDPLEEGIGTEPFGEGLTLSRQPGRGSGPALA